MKTPIYTAVIPAKAGIHFDFLSKTKWIPAFAGMTAETTRNVGLPT
jgi:hypothetical protein